MSTKKALPPQERIEANARSQVTFEMYMAQGKEGLREALTKLYQSDQAKDQAKGTSRNSTTKTTAS